jgi:DNA-binding protein HU-beta
MNKSQLVDALADRLGDRRTAATAVDALLQIVVDTVRAGDSVSLAGFGVFESRARAARTGRNPRTGEAVDVPATTVPAFRPAPASATPSVGTRPQDAGNRLRRPRMVRVATPRARRCRAPSS